MVGILGIDPAVRESAIAMGMTSRQMLWQVEMPLAARTILAGIRVATVTTIGTAAIAGAIGAGGWEISSFEASRRWIRCRFWLGPVPAALLALLADGGLGWIEKHLSPA